MNDQDVELTPLTAGSRANRKVVLITGCSAGGIGSALAKDYHSKGLWVFATARNTATMKDLDDLGITTMELEVTDIENIRKVRDEVASLTGGRLDILVNNAGLAYWSPLADSDMSRHRELFEVNVMAPMAMTQEFLPLLIESGDARIVMLGSVCAVVPMPYVASYNASKAALLALGNTLRYELQPFNIKLINVLAGGVQTNIKRNLPILPSTSLYREAQKARDEHRIQDPLENAVSPEVFAAVLTKESLKASPKIWLWEGTHSWVLWFIHRVAGSKGFDFLANSRFALAEVTADFKHRRAKQKSV